MKLSPRDASRYFRKPDPDRTGLLIFGADAIRVATRRQEVIAALVGPEGEAEMRLTRINAGDLRKDPALLGDAIKEQGFFPGARVAFVEGASDALAKPIGAALDDWQKGDAQIIVTASQLTAKSALRKLFEGHNNAYCVGLYDDPPSREEIEAIMKSARLPTVGRDAMEQLTVLSRMLEPGDFRQTVEKLGLYKHGDDTEVSIADINACAPQSSEAALDDVLNIVAEAKADQIGPTLRKLYAQGVNPVALCIGANRHFRALHTVASDPGGVNAGIGRLRPPVFGPRRERMARQASKWGRANLEEALAHLIDTDLQLRSADTAPKGALVERMLIRIAMLARRTAR
ncbi:DNA polymerase III subunit delta [Octadecabacter sp. SW4]|uniref:DNA polymerase III subunit delta n=1 Tax=Octadecabacter sp. SW4 TaxID=2602067 RepID=UPI0011C1DE2B|nr:DNA polymerase III subunit delta [Octadecabacter sp. SW4]QEE36951.1 DNA polymerase III subunit delta [Octadecabacter sp. SW4]